MLRKYEKRELNEAIETIETMMLDITTLEHYKDLTNKEKFGKYKDQANDIDLVSLGLDLYDLMTNIKLYIQMNEKDQG